MIKFVSSFFFGNFMKNLILENISEKELKERIKELYAFLKSKMSKIDRDPKVFFKRDQRNADDFLGKTGYYDPDNEEIYLYITDRHGKDILRSFAHEIIHHEQNCSGITDKLDMSKTQEADYASKDKSLRNLEKDAFTRGNMFFRDWTDSLKAKREKETRVMNEKLKQEIKNIIKELLEEKKKPKKNPVKDAENKARSNARQHLKNFTGKDVEEQEAKEKLQESSTYSVLVNGQERLMQEAFNKRENNIYDQLLEKFTK